MTTIHRTAEIGDGVTIGERSAVWHFVQIRERARVGDDCVIARGVYVGPGVTIGDATKIQNHAMVYDPAVVGSGVFIGPGVILTNDVYPRSVEPDLQPKRTGDWEADGVTIDDGASIGAGSVVLAGVSVGRWALVAAGSVVIRPVPAHALVAGNPAQFKGWVGRTGRRLRATSPNHWVCDDTGDHFEERAGRLELVGEGRG